MIYNAWDQRFGDGLQNYYSENYDECVRAVRAF